MKFEFDISQDIIKKRHEFNPSIKDKSKYIRFDFYIKVMQLIGKKYKLLNL